MKTKDFIMFLKIKCACPEAMRWVRKNKNKTPGQLWRTCPEPSWLLWLVSEACGCKAEDDLLYEILQGLCMFDCCSLAEIECLINDRAFSEKVNRKILKVIRRKTSWSLVLKGINRRLKEPGYLDGYED